jgi:hypothetical protein
MLADSTSAAHCNGWDFDTPVRKEPRDVLAPEVMSPHGPVSTVRCDAVICPELDPDRTRRRHGQTDAIDPLQKSFASGMRPKSVSAEP